MEIVCRLFFPMGGKSLRIAALITRAFFLLSRQRADLFAIAAAIVLSDAVP
jgi:hypothetical protein